MYQSELCTWTDLLAMTSPEPSSIISAFPKCGPSVWSHSRLLHCTQLPTQGAIPCPEGISVHLKGTLLGSLLACLGNGHPRTAWYMARSLHRVGHRPWCWWQGDTQGKGQESLSFSAEQSGSCPWWPRALAPTCVQSEREPPQAGVGTMFLVQPHGRRLEGKSQAPVGPCLVQDRGTRPWTF